MVKPHACRKLIGPMPKIEGINQFQRYITTRNAKMLNTANVTNFFMT